MEAISIREAARRLGVCHSAVGKRIKAGTLPALPGGKLDWATVQRQWTENRDDSKVRKPAVAHEASHRPGSSERNFNDAKTRREYVRLKKEALQLKQLQGKLVDRSEMEAAVFKRARSLRDALLNIPNRICDTLAAETDAHKIRLIFQAEIRQILTEITKEPADIRPSCRSRKKNSSTRIYRKKND